MILLSLDPSSTITGFALLDERERLIKAAVFQPNKRNDLPLVRIDTMCADLGNTLQTFAPDTIVMEIPSQHVNKGRHTGGGAGLATYGLAVGHYRQELRSYCDGTDKTLVCVEPETWTNGRNKRHRIEWVERIYPQYSIEVDPGGDIADAIALGVWWLREIRASMVRGGVAL